MNKDLRKNSAAQLKTLLAEKTKAYRDFKLDIAKSKVKNVKHGKNLKKEVAHILTLINESKEVKA